jgi:hypothetical protein
MNLNTLEKLARQALKGTDVAPKSSNLVARGRISSTEHRSLTNTNWQIATNGSAATVAYVGLAPQGAWL